MIEAKFQNLDSDEISSNDSQASEENPEEIRYEYLPDPYTIQTTEELASELKHANGNEEKLQAIKRGVEQRLQMLEEEREDISLRIKELIEIKRNTVGEKQMATVNTQLKKNNEQLAICHNAIKKHEANLRLLQRNIDRLKLGFRRWLIKYHLSNIFTTAGVVGGLAIGSTYMKPHHAPEEVVLSDTKNETSHKAKDTRNWLALAYEGFDFNQHPELKQGIELMRKHIQLSVFELAIEREKREIEEQLEEMSGTGTKGDDNSSTAQH